MCKYLVMAVYVCLLPAVLFAEAPVIEWERTFGGEDADYANCVAEIAGIGYVVAGNYAPGTYEHDFYVIKTDLDGNCMWDATFGGDQNDVAMSVLVTSDGGFLVCGPEESFLPNGTDAYVLRLNQDGGTIWSNVYGYESIGESPVGMCRLLDGNYLILNYGLGNGEWYIWKIDPDGLLLNEVTISCPRHLYQIIATSDSGAMVVGDGLLLLKLDHNGDSTWTQVHAGSSGKSVVQLDDGGYAAVGEDTYYLKGYDFRLLRLDELGEILWERNYGIEYDEYAYSLKQTLDGGFVVAGTMYPPDGVSSLQIWIVRTDAGGDTLWTKTLGGDMNEIPSCIVATTDSGYIVAGQTYSYGAGSLDAYLVKLGPDPGIVTDVGEDDEWLLPRFLLMQNYPNPCNPVTTIEYSLPNRSDVNIEIFDVLGRRVRLLVNDRKSAGAYRVTWDGTDQCGKPVSTGVYLYRIQAGDYVKSRKMLLIK
ncbi:T9SS type A sorting domain-containing protein [bacterium]|nr:T9SS type A sorting domain-containing protein [bacterium]